MFDVATAYFDDIATAFFDSGKRVFVLYLFSAGIVALFFLVFIKKQRVYSAIRFLFAKDVWWSQSSRADYKIFFINKLIALFLSPLLITQLAAATAIFYFLFEHFPSRPIIFAQFSDGAIALIFTFCYLLLDDFARFYVHRLMHRWPLLWAFHKMHHSAETLTPITVFRTHPVEMVVFSLRSTLVQAIAIGGFVFFMGDRADLMTVIGANIFVFIFNLLGSNLRHSHIGVYYWKPIEKIIISPAQHQIHHSVDPAHWNKNYGVVLAVWDWLFGCHHYAEKQQQLVFGLSRVRVSASHGLAALYLSPVKEAWNILRTSMHRTYRKCTVIFSASANMAYLKESK